MAERALTECKFGSPESRRLALRYVLRHPVAFREYFVPKVSKRPFWHRYTFTPVLMALEVDDTMLAAGRGSGKSFAVLEPEQVRHAITHPGEETMITSLRKVHIVDRLERVIEYFETVPFLRLYKKRVLRSPSYQIELHTGHNIYGISVGDDPEAKMAQGKHVSKLTVEESQQYPERAWMKLQGAKDPRGCTTLMVGVPDGRLDTPFRKADSKYDSFKNRRFHISRIADPFFNQKTKQEFINQYGGEDRDDYLHEVKAEWGNPVWSAWDLDALYRCVVDDKELPKFYQEISAKQFRESGVSPHTFLADLPRPKGEHRRTLLALDVGYTQPTEIGVFREWGVRWRLEARVRLVDRMEHDVQAALIHEIGLVYNVEQIALDSTEGQGRAMAVELEKHERWTPRTIGGVLIAPIVRVGFNETHISGWTPEGEELKETSKEIGTFMIRKMFAATAFALPKDEDIPTEFNKEREMKTQEGKVKVVTPVDVHTPDMFRVFGMMLFLNNPPVPPGQGPNEFVDPEWGETSLWGSPSKYL